MKLAIYELLRADGSIVVNKRLARAIGLHEAMLFSELLSREAYFDGHNMLSEDGYFFNTIEDLEAATTLSGKQQRAGIRKLEQIGLIKYKVEGLPAKRYFRVCHDPAVIQGLLGQKNKPKGDTVDLFVDACRQAGGSKDVSPEELENLKNEARNDQKRRQQGKRWKGSQV